MKSFENINISIKVKLFCVKNVFFWKKLLFERKFEKLFFLMLFETKNFFSTTLNKKFFLNKFFLVKKFKRPDA